MTGPAAPTSVDTELAAIVAAGESIRTKVRALDAAANPPNPNPIPPNPIPPTTGNPHDSFLFMPDRHTSLRNKPHFAIRTANVGTWDAARGMNNLGQQVVIAAAAAVGNKTYTEDKGFFTNPERGTFAQVEGPDGGYDQISASWLTSLRANEGHTLVRRINNLRAFRGTDTIPSSYKDGMINDAKAALEAGVKFVLRLAYDYDGNAENDVPVQRMLRHLTQIAEAITPWTQAYAGVEHGLIGKWGELHSSSNFSHEWWQGGGPGSWPDRPPVAQAVLNAFPQHQVPIRYPRILYYLLNPGGAPRVTGSARLGFVNDYMLGGGDDEGGTYYESQHSTPDGRAWLRSLLERSGRMVGGEFVRDGVNDQWLRDRFVHLQQQDWSYVNAGYDPQTLDFYRGENHPEGGKYYDVLRNKIGYRLALRRAALPAAIVAGQPFNVAITLDNVGWAAPFNDRPVLFVLRDRVTGVERHFPLTTNANVKAWAGGEVTVSGTFTL